jgi:hypothetical protein
MAVGSCEGEGIIIHVARFQEERVKRLTRGNRLPANARCPPPQPPFARPQPFLPKSCGGHLPWPSQPSDCIPPQTRDTALTFPDIPLPFPCSTHQEGVPNAAGDMRHADCDGLTSTSCKTFDICKAREPGMASYLETDFAHLHHCTATRSVSEHYAPLRLLCP